MTSTTVQEPGGSSQSGQTQRQAQTQSIEISIGSAGNPDLENRIFRDVHSVGRQLARMSDAIAILLNQAGLGEALAPVDNPSAALAAFQTMRAEIRKEVGEGDARLLEPLQALHDRHPDRFAALAPKLRDLLNGSASDGQ